MSFLFKLNKLFLKKLKIVLSKIIKVISFAFIRHQNHIPISYFFRKNNKIHESRENNVGFLVDGNLRYNIAFF